MIYTIKHLIILVLKANFLSKTFNYIILPSFESQELVKKNKIRCVNRDLLQLKHYLFQKRLQAKCDLINCALDMRSLWCFK